MAEPEWGPLSDVGLTGIYAIRGVKSAKSGCSDAELSPTDDLGAGFFYASTWGSGKWREAALDACESLEACQQALEAVRAQPKPRPPKTYLSFKEQRGDALRGEDATGGFESDDGTRCEKARLTTYDWIPEPENPQRVRANIRRHQFSHDKVEHCSTGPAFELGPTQPCTSRESFELERVDSGPS
jgi:hypothetical protein